MKIINHYKNICLYSIKFWGGPVTINNIMATGNTTNKHRSWQKLWDNPNTQVFRKY